MSDLEILATNIKIYRQLKPLTQAELASKIGMSCGHLSKIETAKTDNIGIRFLTRIRQELNVELFQLFMEDPEELCVKFIVSNENLQSLERLIEKISRQVNIKVKQGPGDERK